jgi:enoyl-CoA hydratase
MKGELMAYENIIFSVEEGIGTLIFNRPKALNALNAALLNEMSILLNKIETNEDVRVLILTGGGEKSFVAGADINELATFDTLQGKNFARKGQQIISRLQELSIPVIAAVNGFALGGGCEIALACDFIYASENALFGLPEINLGIIPGFGGTQRLARLVGINMAKEMIFTGKMLKAAQAKQIGLVNKIFNSENLMIESIKTAKNITTKGKVSLRAAKQAINNGLNVDLVSGCKIEVDAFSICMSSKDGKEGTRAFIEKRKPNFTGKLNY